MRLRVLTGRVLVVAGLIEYWQDDSEYRKKIKLIQWDLYNVVEMYTLFPEYKPGV